MTDTLSRGIESEAYLSGKYVSSPLLDKSRDIESSLFSVFEDEINSKNGVLLYYNPAVIKKMTKFISGNLKRCASIGIAGETASGKSTITLDMIDTIEKFVKKYNLERVITRINTDDYYYDRSEEVRRAGGMSEFAKNYDFDVPEALELSLMRRHITELLEGNSVMLPKYDMSGTTIRIDNCTPAYPSKVIISEGLFTLTDEIKNAFDFKIYVDIDKEVQKERFFIRAKERGLGASSQSIYENASNKAEIYIRPCRKEADIVLSGEADREGYKRFLNRILSVIERNYFINR